MKLYIVAVHDRAADAYMQPGFAHHLGQAIRQFTDMVNDPKHDLAKHPEDYALYCIGIWDDNTGEIKCEEPKPRLLAVAKDLAQHKTPTSEDLHPSRYYAGQNPSN